MRKFVIKGASELILESCSKFHSFEGRIDKMDNETKIKVEKSIES